MRHFMNKRMEGLTVNRASIGILLFILFVLFGTGAMGNISKSHTLGMGYKRTISTLNEVMQITDYERDKTFTSGTLIYMYIVEALMARFKGTDCNRSQADVCKEISPYRTYNGKSPITDEIYSGGLKMSVGKQLFMFSSPETTEDPVYITVDFNGSNNLPNRLGWDTFVFEIVDGHLVYMGDEDTQFPVSEYDFYCSSFSTSASDLLGVNCAYKLKNDKAYFKKLDFKKLEKEMKK